MGGFALGGVAQGWNEADKIAVANREAATKESLADTRSQSIDLLRNKMLRDEADKSISGTLAVTMDTINHGKAAGADPTKIGASIQPLLDDITGIAKRIGRDPSPYLHQVQATLDAPTPIGEAKPQTELGKLHADLKAGLIKPEEFNARVHNLTAPAHQPNAVESIRQKISAGSSLSPGEQKVYDDALKADPLARLLIGLQGGASASPGQPSPAAPAAVAAPLREFLDRAANCLGAASQ